MTKTLLSFLLFALILPYTTVGAAEGFFSYAGFNIHHASANLDEDGSTSMEDEAIGFSLFAASRLYKKLHLEYGYKDLGKYTADYDFTVGSFRLVESHKIDFSQAIYTGLILKASLGEILESTELNPGLAKLYLHIGLGALLWNAELEMTGDLYDSGTLLSPYGATGDDTGLSHYFELGLGYELNKKLILNLIISTYFDVGKGVELQRLDGSQEEFQGKDIDTVNLGLTYMF